MPTKWASRWEAAVTEQLEGNGAAVAREVQLDRLGTVREVGDHEPDRAGARVHDALGFDPRLKFVAQLFVGADALDLRLDVGHEGLPLQNGVRCAPSSR